VADSCVDLLTLNRDILLNPIAAGSNELVLLLELEKPSLEFLCPLARAIYWIETNRQDHIDVNEVLGSLWLIDEKEALGTGYYGDDYADVTEVVHHSVLTAYDGLEICLGFKSSTTMVHYKELWPEYLRKVSAQDIEPRTSPDHHHLIDQWLTEIDEETKRIRRSPNGYPTDSGEFIGTCRYTLTSINGLIVDGPTFSDSYHEQGWDGLSEDYPQRWNDEEENSSFCWLHYLSREQAEQIGIAVKGKHALGKEADYPEWVPKKLVADLEDHWISSECIRESYSNGDVIVEPSTKCLVAVGCGADWDPSDSESQIDSEVADLEAYPVNAGPLLRIEISRSDESLPRELEALLPYIEKLQLLSC
jgi:hypothetical protein